VTLAHESSRRTKREKRDADWYWKRRGEIERQLEQIAKDCLVRAGPEIESVVFYEPYEIDCPHGRRTKTCVTIHGMLVQYRDLTTRLSAIAPTNPRRKGFQRRVDQFLEEIKALDPTISPEAPDPTRFCAPTSREIVDGRARAEIGPTWHQGQSGRPPDTVRRYLLESVGEWLYREEVKGKKRITRRAASDIIAEILMYCFDERDTGDLERRWREWRAETTPTQRTNPGEPRSAREGSHGASDTGAPGP